MLENTFTALEIENSFKSLEISNGCKVLRYKEVIRLGEKSDKTGSPPTPEDVGIIMYTSGSTGYYH